nr:DNA-binding protein H-NS, plasmid [Escherichia coli]
MLEDGIDPEELLSSFSAKSGAPKKFANRALRNINTLMLMVKRKLDWPGRTPKALAEQLEAGKTLDDFLI